MAFILLAVITAASIVYGLCATSDESDLSPTPLEVLFEYEDGIEDNRA